jgi:hypothetical protein
VPHPRPAKFSLAANYDPELVPALAPYPVDEVYGRFPTDGVSSGRPHYLVTPLSEADLRRYIRLLDHHGRYERRTRKHFVETLMNSS